MDSNRRAWFALLGAALVACGGRAAESGAASGGSAGQVANGGSTSGGRSTNGGSANAGSASGGRSTNGGSTNGGSASGGSSGQAANGGTGGVCCALVEICPAGAEQIAGAADCPPGAMCYSLPACCSVTWCAVLSSVDGGAAPHACAEKTCTASQACVAYRTEGGVLRLPDAGTCAANQHLENGVCTANFSYECVELGGRCSNGTVNCACAQPLDGSAICPSGYNSCFDPAPSDVVDPSAQLECEALVP